MKIAINYKNFKYLSDNSNECDENTIFVQTTQNSKFEDEARAKNAKIISPKECLSLLDIKNIKIIAITGTNGKTTTAAAIYSTLLDLGYKVALQGTRGAFVNQTEIMPKSLTTPPFLQTLANLQIAQEQKCEFFIMEVSSHAIAQKRTECLEFALKVFTNLSQDHLDFHETFQNYANVKSSFFSDESVKLINVDDKLIKFNTQNLYTYSLNTPSLYKVSAYSLKQGINAIIAHKDKIFEINSILMGEFNLYNLTAALSAVHILTQKDPELIQNALENFGGVKGRMQIISQIPKVIVDFAHTPDGIEKVLQSLKSPNLVVVFGAGGNRDKTKRPLMGKITARYAKKVYITSDNPRDEAPEDIIEDIKQGINNFENIFIEPEREMAIKQAISNLKQDEILLILGKGDETYQEVKGKKFDFDDAMVAQKYLKDKIS